VKQPQRGEKKRGKKARAPTYLCTYIRAPLVPARCNR
jgi:hypothetical protein